MRRCRARFTSSLYFAVRSTRDVLSADRIIGTMIPSSASTATPTSMELAGTKIRRLLQQPEQATLRCPLHVHHPFGVRPQQLVPRVRELPWPFPSAVLKPFS